MKITAVESSTLATVGYDEGSALLELEFRGGAVYRYFAVPSAEHDSLLAAGSKGRHFNERIRGRYPFARVNGQAGADGAAGAGASGSQGGGAWPAR
jgi:lysyl-tRNA synthetase class 2